jgi:hypothetical protein
MTIERIKVLQLCAGRQNDVIEEVEAVFHSPVPQRLNLFDYKRVEKLCVHYETTWSGSAQVHMLIREIDASPFGTVYFTSSGEGSLKSGGIYLKPGDTIEARVSVSSGVRKVAVKLLGLEIASSLIRAM